MFTPSEDALLQSLIENAEKETGQPIPNEELT